MSNNVSYEFVITLVQSIMEVLSDKKMTDDLKALRIDGLIELNKHLEYYRSYGYMDKLINKIAEKKKKMIINAKTKKEMKKIVEPSFPKFNGSKFITDEYSVIEEELICWSQASLIAPLNETGFKRYVELFNILLPEYKDKLNNME